MTTISWRPWTVEHREATTIYDGTPKMELLPEGWCVIRRGFRGRMNVILERGLPSRFIALLHAGRRARQESRMRLLGFK